MYCSANEHDWEDRVIHEISLESLRDKGETEISVTKTCTRCSHKESSVFTFTLTKEQLAEIEEEKKAKAVKHGKKKGKKTK